MKYPYGISDFKSLVTEGYYYCDRTDRIAQLEDMGKYLLFIRPRRFGKSLLLSTLKYYYDAASKNSFGRLFSKLEIGKNPTPLFSRYLILHLDFSCVYSNVTTSALNQALHSYLNSCIKDFSQYYRNYLNMDISINEQNALISMQSLFLAVHVSGYPLYILIDEYDHLVNKVITDIEDGQDVNNILIHQNGLLKTLFKVLKSAAGQGNIDRIFITGRTPVVMYDIGSGFNIVNRIYFDRRLNDLCGFTESETEQAINLSAAECGINRKEVKKALDKMKTYFNGNIFSPKSDTRIYNPALINYFISEFRKTSNYPQQIFDNILAGDDEEFTYIPDFPGGRQLLRTITQEQGLTTISNITDRFGIKDILSDKGMEQDYIKSFLYYLGILTIAGINDYDSPILRIPNLYTKKLYVEKIQKNMKI